MQDVYVWSRKIHRFTLFFTIVLGLIQMMTGLMMKFDLEFAFFDLGQARNLHNITSIYFVVALGLQMLTGTYMYVHPWILRWINNRGN